MHDLRIRLHVLIDEIVDALEARAPTEWVSQRNSPLGRQRHTALVRAGVLKGSKDGKTILVKRSDIEAYIRSKAVIVVDPEADERLEVSRLAAEINRKYAAQDQFPPKSRKPRQKPKQEGR